MENSLCHKLPSEEFPPLLSKAACPGAGLSFGELSLSKAEPAAQDLSWIKKGYGDS